MLNPEDTPRADMAPLFDAILGPTDRELAKEAGMSLRNYKALMRWETIYDQPPIIKGDTIRP